MFSGIVAIRAGNATGKGTTMTSGPQPRTHDAEETPTSSGESLEEATERTEEVMAEAREQVNRARATFHDQIIPSGSGVEDLDYQDHGSEREPRRESEPEPEPDAEGDDTKAAWPNWT
jgi:hypothetical protein